MVVGLQLVSSSSGIIKWVRQESTVNTIFQRARGPGAQSEITKELVGAIVMTK